MKIRVEWLGQARAVAGCDSEDLDCVEGTSVAQVLALLAEKHGGALRGILLSDTGAPHPSVMIFVNDDQISLGQTTELREGDELTVMPPISGG